jgi:hypothetical protein
MSDLIENIARQWFEREPTTGSPDWDGQPASIQSHYRALAEQFWREPGK